MGNSTKVKNVKKNLGKLAFECQKMNNLLEGSVNWYFTSEPENNLGAVEIKNSINLMFKIILLFKI